MVMTPGGGIWLVELKTEKGRLSKAQELWHSRAAKLGTQVFVACGRAGVDGWIARTRAVVEGQNIL